MCVPAQRERWGATVARPRPQRWAPVPAAMVGRPRHRAGLRARGFIPAGAAEVQGAAAAGNELVKMKKGHK